MNIGQFLNEEKKELSVPAYEGDLVADTVAAYEANMDLREVMVIEGQLSKAYDTLASVAADRAAAIVSGNESADDESLNARMEATVTAVASTLGIGEQIVAGNESATADEKGEGLAGKLWVGIVNAVKVMWKKIKDFVSAVGKMIKGLFASKKTAADKFKAIVDKIEDGAAGGVDVPSDKVKKVAEAMPFLFVDAGLSKESIITLIEDQEKLVKAYADGKIYDTLIGSMDAIYQKLASKKVLSKEEMSKLVYDMADKLVGETKDLGKDSELLKQPASVKAMDAVAKKAGITSADVKTIITKLTGKGLTLTFLAVAKEDGVVYTSDVLITADDSTLKNAKMKTLSKKDLEEIYKKLEDAVKNVEKASDSIEKKLNDGSKDVDKALDIVSKNLDSSKKLDGDKILIKENIENLKVIMKDLLPKMFTGATATVNDLVNSKVVMVAEVSIPKKEK